MSLRIKDILTLPALKNFQLVAGETGLDNDVITAGIADYEFAEGLIYDLTAVFEKDSMVISSLLFARNQPELILPAVKALHQCGASGFAYKNVLFDTLPDEVLTYADDHSFPIFSFPGDIWFENIIFDIMAAVERDDERHLSEEHIEKMIKGTISQEEVNSIRHGISLLLGKKISAAYIKLSEPEAARVYRSYYMSKNLRDKMIAAKYEDGIFLLITTLKSDDVSHGLILKEAWGTLSLPGSYEDATRSQLHDAAQLHKAFQEAYYAWLANLLLFRKTASFNDLGVLPAIMPLSATPELQNYSERYLVRLQGYEETIASYIKNGGDIIATSVDLECHANTIRYRLNKIKALAQVPNQTDYELFRDLSIAYMVMHTNSRSSHTI